MTTQRIEKLIASSKLFSREGGRRSPVARAADACAVEYLEQRRLFSSIADLGASAFPVGINDSGTVAVNGPNGAFVYTGGTTRALPGPVTGINNNGQVVGTDGTDASGNVMSYIDNNGTVTALGALAASDGSHVYASGGINGNGQFLAKGPNPLDGQPLAYLASNYLTGNGTLTKLVFFGNNTDYLSLAGGLNNEGQVAGVDVTSAGVVDNTAGFHAFLYSGGTVNNLGPFTANGNGTVQGSITGINDSGQIIGTDDGTGKGFRIDAGGNLASAVDLGALHSGDTVTPEAINSLGQIVGESQTPFIYNNGMMTDLNSLVDPSSGWVLQSAVGINSQDQIIGAGTLNGVSHGFVLQLTPQDLARAHFDFGTSTSPVAGGYTRVSEATAFSAAQGYGWQSAPAGSRDRGAVAGTTALTQDFDFVNSTGSTFAVNLPNGNYNVTVTLGDATTKRDLQGLSLEGTQVDSVTTNAGQFYTRTYPVTVSDGQLNVLLKDLGGTDGSATIDALDVVPTSAFASAAPAAPVLLAASDSGTTGDNVTSFNNSSVAKKLQFSVGNSVAGALVSIYADGNLIGSATASSTTTTVSTNGTASLTDGTHQITARQTAFNQNPSIDSGALGLKVDTAAPTVSAVSAPNVLGGGATSYSFTVTYGDANGVDITKLDGNDALVQGPNSFSQLAAFVSVDTNSNGAPRTATYRITPPGGAWAGTANGPYTITLEPGQVADVAANAGPAVAKQIGSFTVNAGPFAAHYDFGTSTSPVASGYTRVSDTTAFSAAQGYGWQNAPAGSRDRGAVAGTTPLTQDFDFANSTGSTFAVNVPNGIYDVTVTMGDATTKRDSQGVFLEGTQVDSVTTNAGQFSAKTYQVTVSDGQLDLLLKDLGGADAFATIDGLDVAQVFTAHYDFGTSTSPVAAGYTRVADTTAFSTATGFGWLTAPIGSRDRGAVSGTTPLTQDFDFASSAGSTFAVNLANGVYNVTVTMGDATTKRDNQGVFLEGAQVDTVTTNAGAYYTKTYQATVNDGQLTLLLKDLGGNDPYAVIDGLDIAGM